MLQEAQVDFLLNCCSESVYRCNQNAHRDWRAPPGQIFRRVLYLLNAMECRPNTDTASRLRGGSMCSIYWMQWNAVPIPILLQDCAVARCGEWKERNECKLLVCLSVELTDIREKMSWTRRCSGSSPKCNHLFIGPLQTFHENFRAIPFRKFSQSC